MPDPLNVDRVDVAMATLSIVGVIENERIYSIDGGPEAQTDLNPAPTRDPLQPTRMQLGQTHYANMVFRRPWTKQDELKQWRADTARGQARAKTGELRLIDREGAFHIIELRDVWLARWKLDLGPVQGTAYEEFEIAVEGWEIS